MTSKYYSEIYIDERSSSYVDHRLWRGTWSCREFAQRDIRSMTKKERYGTHPLTVRIGGLNMRNRYLDEQEGMARFASLLLPNNLIKADSTSIWIELERNKDNQLTYPPEEVYSLLLFYIKNLSIQMRDRVDFERVCKALIKRRHQVFKNIPDQQLGTALYFFSFVKYPKKILEYSKWLSASNGPGTAMRQLAHMEGEHNVPIAATEFYFAMMDEWCGAFKKELRYILDHHSKGYARLWYLPLLIQDVYNRVYDGDGRFDNIEYGDDQW